MRIIFPTIERVKNARNGIFPSKRILCFSEVWPYSAYCNISLCWIFLQFCSGYALLKWKLVAVGPKWAISKLVKASREIEGVN